MKEKRGEKETVEEREIRERDRDERGEREGGEVRREDRRGAGSTAGEADRTTADKLRDPPDRREGPGGSRHRLPVQDQARVTGLRVARAVGDSGVGDSDIGRPARWPESFVRRARERLVFRCSRRNQSPRRRSPVGVFFSHCLPIISLSPNE